MGRQPHDPDVDDIPPGGEDNPPLGRNQEKPAGCRREADPGAPVVRPQIDQNRKTDDQGKRPASGHEEVAADEAGDEGDPTERGADQQESYGTTAAPGGSGRDKPRLR